jgi:hypothetical protein
LQEPQSTSILRVLAVVEGVYVFEVTVEGEEELYTAMSVRADPICPVQLMRVFA